MNNILIIGIITVAIIIAVAVLMRMRMSQPSSTVMPNGATDKPSLAVMPGRVTEPQFIVYSDVNFTGESRQLPGPGEYPLDPECGAGKSTPLIQFISPSFIPFKPKSVKMPDGYRLGFKGWYGNEGDTKCGPSITWATDPSQFSDLTKAFSNWIYTYVGGSIVIEKNDSPLSNRHY